MSFRNSLNTFYQYVPTCQEQVEQVEAEEDSWEAFSLFNTKQHYSALINFYKLLICIHWDCGQANG